MLGCCRYGSTFAVQPMLIRGSQSDWLDEQEWSFEAMSHSLKNVSLYDEDEENCREGQADRQTKECHSIKEHDPSLVGKAWASLAAVDLVGLGVSTYDALFDKQVCTMPACGRRLQLLSGRCSSCCCVFVCTNSPCTASCYHGSSYHAAMRLSGS